MKGSGQGKKIYGDTKECTQNNSAVCKKKNRVQNGPGFSRRKERRDKA